MNKHIFIHIHSYKENSLYDSIQNLIKNASGKNNLHIFVDDQNNLTRAKYFVDVKEVRYNAVWWDEFLSPLHYTKLCIDSHKENNFDYALLLQQCIDLPQNWDTYLINNLKENEIFSGLGNYKNTVSDNFYINRENIETFEIIDTGQVDRRFIFGDFKYLSSINLPIELKHYGQNEYFSLMFLNDGVTIKSLPTNFYKYVGEDINNRGYVPFSLNHNYDAVLKILLNKTQIKLKTFPVDKFLNYVKINLEELHTLPYDFNDVEYDRHSSLDTIGGKRYIVNLTSVS
jgi:hypothetical protein